MSRARRRKTTGPPDPRPASAPARPERKDQPRTKRTPRLLAVAVAAALAVVITGILLLRGTPPDAERIAFAPPPPLPTDTIGPDDFAGADACAECHTAQYGAWRASTHGRAGAVPPTDILLRAFDGRPIRFRDAVVTPRVIDGAHAFVVAQEGREPVTLRVDGVVGGGHMVGGGTQGFFTRWADGTLRFLPFELVRREGVWFCNTGTRLDGGWLPITADMRLADCGDWPPARVQG